LTTAALLMSLRVSHATAQEGTAAIAGNHPNIALTGWKPAAGDLKLRIMAVLALRDLQSNRMSRFYYAQTVPGGYRATVDDARLFGDFCSIEALERLGR
jgi:hypothetical protein